MFDNFISQILVLILLFFSSARVFSLKHSRVDCFAAFASLALISTLFIFVCFDFSLVNFSLFLLALLVFFINFRAILRLNAQLIVDSYSPIFIVFSIISLILTLGLAFVIILFRPVKYTEKDFNAIKERYTLSGNISNLHIRESYLSGERFSGNLFIYRPVILDNITEELYSKNPTLIFTPGIRANVQNYEPYLMLLAGKGYKVMAADLYTSDTKVLSKNSDSFFGQTLLDTKFFRRAAALHLDSKNPKDFEKLILENQSLASRKYSALTKLGLEIFGDDTRFFYLVDGVDFDSIYSVIDEFNTEPYANAQGFFSMNRIDEYKTPGFGFIEQTDVILAHQKGIPREDKFFIPRYVANKTIEAIMEQKK
ncbi:MAG: hypothetical protein K5873_08500 [Treponema sp.]|nr:hypothetical protein [Treponema sp.]